MKAITIVYCPGSSDAVTLFAPGGARAQNDLPLRLALDDHIDTLDLLRPRNLDISRHGSLRIAPVDGLRHRASREEQGCDAGDGDPHGCLLFVILRFQGSAAAVAPMAMACRSSDSLAAASGMRAPAWRDAAHRSKVSSRSS